MHVSSLSRKAGRGSAVGWFLVLLLICGAGAGYYLYQDNQEKKRVAQELTAERQAKEKAMKAAAEKQRKQREKEIRERREKEREAAELAREEAKKKKEVLEREAAQKLQEQAKREEEEKRRREELERREREEQERRQEEPAEEEEPEPEGRFPQPVKNPMPDLSVYATVCKDEIPMDADKPLETWSWDKAEKLAGMEEFPSGSTPWKRGTDDKRMDDLLERCRSWKDDKPSSLKACSAAKDFPGAPEDGASLVRRTVEIDSNITGWHSTGLYAPPGAEISCSLSGAPKESSLGIRIGCHTDSLHKLDAWRRVPEITVQVPADRGA